MKKFKMEKVHNVFIDKKLYDQEDDPKCFLKKTTQGVLELTGFEYNITGKHTHTEPAALFIIRDELILFLKNKINIELDHIHIQMHSMLHPCSEAYKKYESMPSLKPKPDDGCHRLLIDINENPEKYKEVIGVPKNVTMSIGVTFGRDRSSLSEAKIKYHDEKMISSDSLLKKIKRKIDDIDGLNYF